MTTDCPSSKIRYPTYAVAARLARLYNRLPRKRPLRAYCCPECEGGWHLTSASFAHRERMLSRELERSETNGPDL